AGLLAGSTSMALGEWLSVQSSRELFKRQIEIEAEELESSPEEEAHELALIYRAKGVSEAQAKEMAMRIVENKETAVETLAREELGVDPAELGGSAWTAAITSFVLFAIGAFIPVVPYLIFGGHLATLASLVFSGVGLFGIGSAITLMTGKNIFFSGFRQLLFGLTAAALTYGIGYLLGAAISG
ncbi:MAG: VIT1/CCC1 transporter family protein, partial [Chitinophagales bacterium]